MEYQIFGRQESINFGAKGEEEVLQNVRTYLCTPRFLVVLDRALGIDATVIDRPMNKARAIISADILGSLPHVEPRAKIVSLDFSGDGLDGVLIPMVKGRVNLDGLE